MFLKDLKTANEDDLITIQKIEEYRVDRIDSIMSEIYDPTLVILKGHLLVEEILDQLIIHYCQNESAYYAMELNFFKKINLAQALTGDIFLEKLMGILKSLNSLRNELAHSLHDEKLNKKIRNFVLATQPNFKDNVHLVNDEGYLVQELRESMSYLFGYISCIEVIVRTGKIPPKK